MLRWTLAAAVLLTAGCSNREQELQDRIDQLKAENGKLQTARDTYNSCMEQAQDSYNYTWNRECSLQRADAIKEREICKANGGNDEQCTKIDLPPATGCGLPFELADRHNADFRDNKQQCLGRLKIGN